MSASDGLCRFVTPRLHPACRRLEALGEEWARARGTRWATVLNEGPPPAEGPSWLFRWQVVAAALEFAAGLGPEPEDYPALPVGLQALLSWAIPAALRPPEPVSLNTGRAERALAEAEDLLPAVRGQPDPTRAPQTPAPPSVAPPVPEPGEGGDPALLLARALETGPAPTEPAGLSALRAALARGPLPLAELQRLGERHGVLPGTLLDALDRESLRRTGQPAVRVEGGLVHAIPGPREAGG